MFANTKFNYGNRNRPEQVQVCSGSKHRPTFFTDQQNTQISKSRVSEFLSVSSRA